jgi:hypothetical protein
MYARPLYGSVSIFCADHEENSHIRRVTTIAVLLRECNLVRLSDELVNRAPLLSPSLQFSSVLPDSTAGTFVGGRRA